jgi:hypothetical protein
MKSHTLYAKHGGPVTTSINLSIFRVFPFLKVCKSQVAGNGSGEVSKRARSRALKVAHAASAISQNPVSIYEGSAYLSIPIRGRPKLTLVA